MKKRLRSWSCSLFGLLLCPALLSTAAVGQDITVTAPVGHDVYGNGLSNTGAWDTTWDTYLANQPNPNSNTVTINSNGTVTGRAIGGYKWSYAAANFTVSDNKVLLNGGTVSNDVYGGWANNTSDANNATATNNTVTISGGTVGNSVLGGYSQSVAGAATVNKNTVTISGGAVGSYILGGYAYSGAGGAATASDNQVVISDVSGDATVYGGYARSSGGGVYSGTVKAEHNTVTISGGSVVGSPNGGDVNGGCAISMTAGLVQANNNEMTISGDATVNGSVFGGQAGTSGFAATATATGNIVNISGTAHVNGGVFGGAAYSWQNGAPDSAKATSNTVNISGTPTFGAGAVLYGGDVNGAGGGDVFTGNTLNLHSAGIVVGELGNFQFLNFYVPTGAVNGDTMLHVTGTADLTDGAGRSSTVNVGIDGASSPLQVGNQIILINASQGTLVTNSGLNTTANGSGMQGVTLKYEFDIAADNAAGLLTATVTSVDASDQSESLGQGFLSGMGLLNQGSDLIADWGMSAAVDAANRPNLGSYALGFFGVAAAGSSRYATGSSVDVSGISLMAGIAKQFNTQPGNLMVGAFFEYGNGSYDTYSSFHGDGDLDHFGGGIIGRFDFAGSKTGHFYTEGSARIGSIDNDFELHDPLTGGAKYDASSTYYGIHLGSGYIWNLTDKASLDFYARYFWTQQKGDTVRLSTGETVDFDNINSHRMRIGARFAYAANASISPYVGVAYEHEFDGEARATTKGYALKAPSIDGGTGVGELGLTFKPSAAPISLDLGVQGYAGTREGVTGTLHLRYEF